MNRVFDGVDNDGDGEADSDDSDCFACFSSGEPDLAGFSAMGAGIHFVTAVPDPEQICPFELGTSATIALTTMVMA